MSINRGLVIVAIVDEHYETFCRFKKEQESTLCTDMEKSVCDELGHFFD